MKKNLLVLLVVLLFLTGCSRSPRYRNAAAHLGDPRTIQIFLSGDQPVTITDRNQINNLMEIIDAIEVRILSVEEELDLVLVRGVTLDATEIRFRDNQGRTYKALIIHDGSLMVVEGEVGQDGDRRDLYLSEPNQQELMQEVQRLATGM